MTAVAEARRELPVAEPDKSEAELLDVLYEVLAQGVPPGSGLTAEKIERFLHEHARSKKPVEEMIAFFEQHQLPTDPRAYGDTELSTLASGLHRERDLGGPVLGLEAASQAPLPELSESGEIRRAAPPTQAAAPVLVEESTVRSLAPQRPTSGRWLRGLGVAVAACLTAGLAWSYQHCRVLEAELRQARLQQRTTDSALVSLEQRAEALRGELAQSEAARSTLSERFESFAADARRERATEEAVLRRMLGKRYETLRAQAAAEPTP